MSSFADFGDDQDTSIPADTIFPSSDGLVRGAIDAWARHQHLVLRPDEIWFEILAQLNAYMNTHAEELRDLFVSHQGKEEIEVWDFTWTDVIARFAGEIQSRVKTDWLLGWIMPGFSTTDRNDNLTATVLMMGLMQHYFEFSGGIVCGLPQVTLLGERQDWVRLLGKLDRLADWGDEPAQYAENLRPILTRFVRTWDEPQSEDIKSFWSQIVRADHHFSCGRGAIEYTVSGWITGFMHWNHDGAVRVDPEWLDSFEPSDNTVTLDGVPYISEDLQQLPVGYAKVPLKMLDYPQVGTDTMAYLLAGNVGVKRTPAESNEDFITAQPVSAWFMYAPVETNYTTGPPYGDRWEMETIADAFDVCRNDTVPQYPWLVIDGDK
jgi:hypothetical protein